MVKHTLKFFLFILIYSTTSAQNLLKNGDYEKKTIFVGKPILGFLFFNIYSELCEVKYWDNPNRASPDVHVNGRFRGDLQGEKHSAYSGNHYIGMVFANDGVKDEYAETKLKKKLVKDSLYCIKLHVMADSKIGSYLKRFYVAFNRKYYHQQNKNFFFLPDTVGFQKVDGSVIENTNDYTELSNIYKSSGYENYAIFGLFNKNEPFYYLGESSDYRKVMLYKTKIAYYYFDDISIVPIKDSSQCPCYHYKKSKIYKEAEQIKVGQLSNKKYVLSSIKFINKNAKLNLNAVGKNELAMVADVLQKDSLIKITIVSHVFETDVMPQNKKLSKERAEALKKYFIEQKINAARIEIDGAGSSMPLFDNDSKEHQEKNNRIEIKFD